MMKRQVYSGDRARRPQLSTSEYLQGVRQGDRAILGRAITLIESNHPEHRHQAQELLVELMPLSGGAYRIGITGIPGVGKSTFIESFGERLIELDHRVAVLAVDPSSSLSGGSILGDKTRMPALSCNQMAFIRPSPTGGSLGGVGRKTRESIIVCEAAGYDVVLVETVGVGQSETVVADMIDFFLVLMLAGAGDELQGIKRGIIELADLIAINKADGDNAGPAQRARAEYQRALELLRPEGASWSTRVLTCSAIERKGLDEIWQSICHHRHLGEQQGFLKENRRRQLLRWMWSLVDDELRVAIRHHSAVAGVLAELEQAVLAGELTATRAAERILAAFASE
jgi:LAO/AO transport system kinase